MIMTHGPAMGSIFPGANDSNLYLAIYPPTRNSHVKVDKTNIEWVEREYVKRYELRHHRYPLCNKILPPSPR